MSSVVPAVTAKYPKRVYEFLLFFMATTEAHKFVNGSVTSGLLHKLSNDDEKNVENSNVVYKSLPDYDIVIILWKIIKEKDKMQRKIKISRKENLICNHFNRSFCKFHKQ